MQGLLGGVGDHRLLTVQLLLGEVVHHLPHAGLASHAHTTESFALSIGSVLVKLDLQEVRDSQVLNIVLDVLVCCPPGQVANVQLPFLAILTSSCPSIDRGRVRVLLLGSDSKRSTACVLFIIFVGASSDHIIVQIVVLAREVFLWEILFNIGIKINIYAIRHCGSENLTRNLSNVKTAFTLHFTTCDNFSFSKVFLKNVLCNKAGPPPYHEALLLYLFPDSEIIHQPSHREVNDQ